MIKEEFVSYETAKLLKTAGFPQDIKQTGFYNKHGQDYHFGDGAYNDGCAKPTQAVAMRWLREKSGIFVDLSPNLEAENPLESFNYGVAVFHKDMCLTVDYGSGTSYEAAAEAGIQAACQYIISKGKE